MLLAALAAAAAAGFFLLYITVTMAGRRRRSVSDECEHVEQEEDNGFGLGQLLSDLIYLGMSSKCTIFNHDY